MICTLFIEGRAQIFSLSPQLEGDMLNFSVTCLSATGAITPFAIGLRSGQWTITDIVPDPIRKLEDQLVNMLIAYLEGQGLG